MSAVRLARGYRPGQDRQVLRLTTDVGALLADAGSGSGHLNVAATPSARLRRALSSRGTAVLSPGSLAPRRRRSCWLLASIPYSRPSPGSASRSAMSPRPAPATWESSRPGRLQRGAARDHRQHGACWVMTGFGSARSGCADRSGAADLFAFGKVMAAGCPPPRPAGAPRYVSGCAAGPVSGRHAVEGGTR